jgi:hypothetical protein
MKAAHSDCFIDEMAAWPHLFAAVYLVGHMTLTGNTSTEP